MPHPTSSLTSLAVAVACYLVPAVLHPILSDTSDPGAGKSLVLVGLFVLNPVMALLVSAVHGFRHGTSWWFPLVLAGLFLPVALIPPLNSSAFGYALVYLVFGYLGITLGSVLGRRSGREAPAM